MAGTLFGLGLSQQHDVDGRPMSGCLLYIYAANTTTPAIAYSNPSLAAGLELPWPIVADSAGRIPAFWLADGAYRARLTDENGVVQFDEQNVLAVGSGTGDIITSNVPPEAILTTGCVLWMPVNTTKVGWVRLNGKTIGNSASGASELANDTTALALFVYLYGAFADALCPVSGGRTGNALNDFNASKALTLLDMRGKGAVGLDDMGNVAAGVLAGVAFDAGNATTGGAKGGDAFATLTRANLPNVTLNIAAGQGIHHHLDGQLRSLQTGTGIGPFNYQVDAGGSPYNTSDIGLPAMATESINGGVTQTTVQNISPFMLGTWFMRL
jgi:hypothetical protein